MSGKLLPDLKRQKEDLEARIDALSSESSPIRTQLANLDRQRDKLRNELASVKERIAEMSAKARISDHAVLRYLERKYGFDFENVRGEMLTPYVVAAMDAGVEGVKMNGGTLKIKGRTVTTYIED